MHAGILADRRLETHVAQLADLGVEPFDLVVSNLYPFTQTVASGAGPDECVEQIDIGGPSMVRAAAKNHPSVAIVTSPERYADVLRAVAEGGFTLAERQRLAAEAFVHTATYDVHVASWMGNVLTDTSAGTGFPAWIGATWEKAAVLRYGENPHQARGALHQRLPAGARAGPGRPAARQGDVLQQLRRRRRGPPGGVRLRPSRPWRSSSTPTRAASRSAADVADAHRKAHECDPVSAFGGVIATNRPVSVAMARQVAEVFTEVVVAPGYEDGAVEVLAAKKNIRLLAVRAAGARRRRDPTDLRRAAAAGRATSSTPPGDDPSTWTLATGEAASPDAARRPRLRLDAPAAR